MPDRNVAGRATAERYRQRFHKARIDTVHMDSHGCGKRRLHLVHS